MPSYGIRRYARLDGLYDFQNSAKNTLRFKADYFDEDTDMRFSDASMIFSGRNVVLRKMKKAAPKGPSGIRPLPTKERQKEMNTAVRPTTAASKNTAKPGTDGPISLTCQTRSHR